MFFDRYGARLAAKGNKPHTCSSYRAIVARFCAWCLAEGIDPEAVTEDQMQSYFDALPLATSTKRLHKAHLGGAFRYAHRKGWIMADPTMDVLTPQSGTNIPHTLSNAQLRAMRAAVPDARAHLLFCLFAYTGMRRIEVCRLRWEDVNLVKGTLLVHGKGDKQRVVPIHPTLHEALTAAPYRLGEHVLRGRNGGQMTSPGFEYQWHRTVDPSGVTATAHDLRRTWASSLKRNGVATETIKILGGWAARGIFEMHYLYVDSTQMESAIRKVYADDPV